MKHQDNEHYPKPHECSIDELQKEQKAAQDLLCTQRILEDGHEMKPVKGCPPIW